MRILSRFRALWWNLVHRDRVDAALDAELGAYVDLLADEYERNGMTRAAARRAALVATSGVDQVKEATRDAWAGRAVTVMSRELGYALRSLRRSPAFLVTALISLGVGIGGATAIFTAIEAAFLRPLPAVGDADRLVSLERLRIATSELDDISYLDFRDIRAQSKALAGVAAYNGTPMILTAPSSTAQAWVSYVSDNFFDVLRVRAAAGRLIDASDGVGAGANAVVVLGFELWQDRFGGDPNVIGSTVQLQQRPFTVIGIAPKGFIGAMRLHRMELWIPFGANVMPKDDGFTSRANRWLRVVARLAPGATVEGVQRELSTIADQLAEAYPEDKGRAIRVFPGSSMTEDERIDAIRVPRLLAIAVGLLLLIACANVAGLSLVRASAKRRELATRLALGASRASLVRERFVEGVVLAAGASLLGAFVAQVLLQSATITRTAVGRSTLDVSVDGRMLAASIAVACVTAILVSVAPAFHVSRTQLSTLIKDGSGGAVGSRLRGQRLLVTAQVALSLILVASASVIYSAAHRALHADLGFEPRGLTDLWPWLWPAAYDSARHENFYRELLARAKAEPGVSAAAWISRVPPAWSSLSSIYRRGEEPPPGIVDARDPQRGAHVYVDGVSPGLFDVMRIRLMAGRDFSDRDDGRAPPVAIISHRLARKLWPNESAVGKSIVWPSTGGAPRAPLEIIGVVGDVRHASLADESSMVMYIPFGQHPELYHVLIMRGRGDVPPAASIGPRLVHAIDPSLPPASGGFVVGHVDSEMEPQRVASAWVGVFGAVAVLLTAIGLYGVVAQTVLRRTRELAVRAALGATPSGLLRLILGDGMRITLVGCVAGVAATLAGLKLLRKLFAVVDFVDVRGLLIAGAALMMVMALASYLPARWAARMNPVDALRSD